MIQDKINQLLGIGTLITKGVKDVKVGDVETEKLKLQSEREGKQGVLDKKYNQLVDLGLDPGEYPELRELYYPLVTFWKQIRLLTKLSLLSGRRRIEIIGTIIINLRICFINIR